MRSLRVGLSLLCCAVLIAAAILCNRQSVSAALEPDFVSSSFPSELNPPDGASKATFDQAAEFAWKEFIALNWPAGPQSGQPGQRDHASDSCRFGDPACPGPLVWETFRGKVEIFPGDGNPPPGYPGASGDKSLGYDNLPVYHYGGAIPACDPSQTNDTVPWINLDETDQITLDNMYAGVVEPNVSPGNSEPQLIRFLAKANRAEYVYVAGNSTDPNNPWWQSVPSDVVLRTKAYLSKNQASPAANSSDMVSLPYGTVEMKAGWRPLNHLETESGRFHKQTVRFYEAGPPPSNVCYRDATWGLVALHIIQKTPSAPFFIYATFEQADNILTADGSYVEDADGDIIAKPPPANATSPPLCLIDPRPPIFSPPPAVETTSNHGSVVATLNPATCVPVKRTPYCGAPGKQLYFRNVMVPKPDSSNSEPSGGNICVDRRENAIPDYAINANKTAHDAIAAYFKRAGIPSAPWLYYKLVNVQYYPYDKIISKPAPNGSLYTAKPPYSAANPSPSSFYQANIVVETNRSLQLFSGGLSPNISTDWNSDGTAHKNTYFGGHFYNMGGCMGCHGSQGQNPAKMAGDFSVILARGIVPTPEPPSMPTSQGMTPVKRNRSLTR